MNDFLTVNDLQKILHLGRNKTYELVNRPDFPKLKIGRKILIPKEKFNKYIESKCYSIIK